MDDKAVKPDDPAQSQRFIDMAREAEVDESPEAFDQAFEKVVRGKTAPKPTWEVRPEKKKND